MSFVLTASLVNNSLEQTALAQDLSALKDEATKLLTGNNNSQRTDNKSASTTGNSISFDSSLTQKATDGLSGIYVANTNDNTVSVISGMNNTKIGADIQVGDGPQAIGVNPVSNTI